MAGQTCRECGCQCRSCDQSTLHLHVEIENLKQRLVERDKHIVTMETNFLSEADKFPDGEYAALSEELLTWQEKYSRLYESYKRVQKVNQGLEDKLLRVVDKFESDKAALTRDVAGLTQRLVDARFNVTRFQEENERYRNDLNLAIQFLQCKPANFVPQKYEQLPAELQQKVRTYISSKRRPSEINCVPTKVERRTIKVPIPTFPPTAMVYSVNRSPNEKDLSDEEREIGEGKPPVDIVSAAILAKILEERERERVQTRHCSTCSCPTQKIDTSSQTEPILSMSNASITPGLMNLRYSSSLLGSGESSQVLVSLADESSGLIIPSSQSSSAKQSPGSSISEHKYEEDAMNLRKLTVSNNVNKSFESCGWDDWSLNVSDIPTTQDLKSTEPNMPPQTSEPFQVLPRADLNMPKVSMSSSTGICRMNSTFIPSSASTALSSNWNRVEDSAEESHPGKKFKLKGKILNAQENFPKTFDTNFRATDVSSLFEGSVPMKECGKAESTQHILKNHNSSSKLNQSRLLPETKLFASGDTVEVHPVDSLMYSVECEKRLGNLSNKTSSQPFHGSSLSAQDKKDREKDSRPTGPRPCSLRFQAGSNNILLDNAQSYEPVLYTSRQANANSLSPTSRLNDMYNSGNRLHTVSISNDDSNSTNLGDSSIAPNLANNQKPVQRSQLNRTETGV